MSGAGDNDNASFTISGNELQTAAVFDHENQGSYNIRVRTTDLGGAPEGLSIEEVFTITVEDVNEVPTDISLSNSTVAENAPVGTLVGSFSTIDEDADDTHAYELVDGAADNALFAIVGNELQTAAVFDHEIQESYTIRVRTTDLGGAPEGLSIEEVFTITVTDENDAPVGEDDAGATDEDTLLEVEASVGQFGGCIAAVSCVWPHS